MNAMARARDVRSALLLEWLTVGYMVFEAAAALGLGLLTRSVSLETFGLDSLIELASAGVLIWRLNVETRGQDAKAGASAREDAGLRGIRDDASIKAIERRAAQFVGFSLLVLAAYILFQSLYSLFNGAQAAANVWGIALALTSLVVMPVLAKFKLRFAERIHSRALHADAYETIACAYLSFTLLVGLAANYLFGWWWADALAALTMLYFIVREAREALSGDDEHAHNHE